MFLRQHEPILLTEEGIGGLCASLNRPVVEVEGLPAGPASSAIVLHQGPGDERCLAVALRSEDSGAVILYAFQGELNSSPHQAMDAGLAFAEGMGFLFDDDVIAGGLPNARRQALQIWCQLTGDDAPPQVAASAVSDDLDLDIDLDSELDLDSEIELDDEIQASARRLPPTKTTLTKFRRAGDAPAEPTRDPNEDSVPAQLGRIPIVRRRRKTDTEQEPPLLARLLARF